MKKKYNYNKHKKKKSEKKHTISYQKNNDKVYPKECKLTSQMISKIDSNIKILSKIFSTVLKVEKKQTNTLEYLANAFKHMFNNKNI